MTSKWGGASKKEAIWGGSSWAGVLTDAAAKVLYLIKDGVLGKFFNFTRTGSAIYDGVEFETFVNMFDSADIKTETYAFSTGTTNTSEFVKVQGVDVTKFDVDPSGGYAGVDTTKYAGWGSVDYWVWSNKACSLGFIMSNNTSEDKQMHDLVPGMNYISGAAFGDGVASRRVMIDFRLTTSGVVLPEGLQLAAAVQFCKTKTSPGTYLGPNGQKSMPVRTPDKTKTWVNKCLVDGVPTTRLDGIIPLSGVSASIVYDPVLGHKVYRLDNTNASRVYVKVQPQINSNIDHMVRVTARGGITTEIGLSGNPHEDRVLLPSEDVFTTVTVQQQGLLVGTWFEIYLEANGFIEFYEPQVYEGSTLPPEPIVSSADGPVTKTFVTEVVNPKEYVTCGARENKIYDSLNFSTGWTQQASIIPNYAYAPNGEQEVLLLSQMDSDAYHQIFDTAASNAGIVTGQTRSMGVFAKANTYNTLRIRFAQINQVAFFNLTDGSVAYPPELTCRSTPVGGGWYYCFAAYTATADSASLAVAIGVTDQVATTIGDPTKSILVWRPLDSDSKYPLYPYQIPTIDGPLTMATSAASDVPGNTNGATVDLYEEGNEEWLGLFDGEGGTDKLAPHNFTGQLDGGSLTKSGDVYTLTSDGSAFTSRAISNVVTVGVRYRCTYKILATRGASGVKFNNATINAFWGQSNTVGGYVTTKTATEDTFTIGRQAGGLETDIDFTVTLRETLPAIGSLHLDGLCITPTLAQWEDTGQIKLIMADDGTAILYIGSDGYIYLTDGTNTVMSPFPYVAGQKHDLEIGWDGTGMWMVMDRVAVPAVSFIGTFNPGKFLKFFGTEDKVAVDNIRTGSNQTRPYERAFSIARLVEDGILSEGWDFVRTGDAVYGGEVFETYVNVLDFADFSDATTFRGGVVFTGGTVNIQGVEAKKFSITATDSSFIGQTLDPDGDTFVDFWIWSANEAEVDLFFAESVSTKVRVTLQPGLNSFHEFRNFNIAYARHVIIDNRETRTPNLELAAVAQAFRTTTSPGLYLGPNGTKSFPVRTPDVYQTFTNKCEVDGVPGGLLGIDIQVEPTATLSIVDVEGVLYYEAANTDPTATSAAYFTFVGYVNNLRPHSFAAFGYAVAGSSKLSFNDGADYIYFPTEPATISKLGATPVHVNRRLGVYVPLNAVVRFRLPQLIEGDTLPPTPIVSSADGPVTEKQRIAEVSPKGFVHCGARTNNVRQSSNYADAAWTKQYCAIETNATLAPDGTLTADKIVPDTSVGTTSRPYQAFSVEPLAVHTASTYVKAAEMDSCRFLVGPTSTETAYVIWDLVPLSFHSKSSSVIEYTAIEKQNGWVFLSFSFVASGEGTATVFIQVGDDGGVAPTGDGVKGIYAWGTSVVKGKYPIYPLSIDTGASPLTLATLATDAATDNGLTLDLMAEENRTVQGVLDGVLGANIFTGVSPSFNDFGGSSGYIGPDGLTLGNAVAGTNNSYPQFHMLADTIDGHRYKLSVQYSGDLPYASAVYSTNPVTSRLHDALVMTGDLQVVNFIGTDATYFIQSTHGTLVGEIYPDVFSVQEYAAAAGAFDLLGLTVIPTLTQWQTTGGKLNLMARKDGTDILYIDDTGKFTLTDGTNTVTHPTVYTAGQKHDVTAMVLTDRMALFVDGVCSGWVPFTGTLIDGSDTLKMFFENEDLITYDDMNWRLL